MRKGVMKKRGGILECVLRDLREVLFGRSHWLSSQEKANASWYPREQP